MKKYNLTSTKIAILIFGILIITTSKIMAQAADNSAPASTAPTPVKNTFNSVWLIDNQTVMVPVKGTFEADIQHRFGLMNANQQMDLWGVYAPSNIRLGVSYVPLKDLMVGYGITKNRMLMDFNAKYALLKQTKNGIPVSVTLYGNIAVDTRDASDNKIRYDIDRYSYFSSLMIARKVTKELSLQVSGNLSWMNNVPGYINYTNDANGVVTPTMNNYHFSFSCLGRYKISEKSAIIAGYDQPLTSHFTNNPYPNICFGFETSTSAHSFQIFATTYNSIIPQYNNYFNQNDFNKASFLLGFNITRLWNW